ncbi:MAG: hypothetical protein ACK481_01700 [Candidatus Melainabacteria bacterium]
MKPSFSLKEILGQSFNQLIENKNFLLLLSFIASGIFTIADSIASQIGSAFLPSKENSELTISQFGVAVISCFLSLIIGVGIIKIFLQISRGEKPKLNLLFADFGSTLNFFCMILLGVFLIIFSTVAFLLIATLMCFVIGSQGIGVLIIIISMVIPYVLFVFFCFFSRFTMSTWLLVDKKVTVFQTYVESWKITEKYGLQILGISILLCSISVGLLLSLNALVVLPISSMVEHLKIPQEKFIIALVKLITMLIYGFFVYPFWNLIWANTYNRLISNQK